MLLELTRWLEQLQSLFGLFGYLMDPSPLADGDADRAPEVSSGCAARITMHTAPASTNQHQHTQDNNPHSVHIGSPNTS